MEAGNSTRSALVYLHHVVSYLPSFLLAFFLSTAASAVETRFAQRLARADNASDANIARASRLAAAFAALGMFTDAVWSFALLPIASFSYIWVSICCAILRCFLAGDITSLVGPFQSIVRKARGILFEGVYAVDLVRARYAL